MLETLDLRLDQAGQGRLGYLEFLELLLEDEIGRRAAKGLASESAKATSRGRKTSRSSTGRSIRRFPLLVSETWPPVSSSLGRNPSCSAARSEWGRHSSPRRLAIKPAVLVTRYSSRRRRGCWPIWAVAVPMALRPPPF